MDRKQQYSTQDQYENFVAMKNDKTRYEVCERDIETLTVKETKNLQSFFQTLF